MPITIHKLDSSPPARAVMMTAELLQLEYNTIDVNILTGDHLKPEYLQKNPLHTIPLLEDGDFVLADSHAIITYLVSKYGAEKRAELYPSDLRSRAIIDQRLYFDTSLLFPKVQGIVRSILFQKTKPSEKQIAEVNEAYGFVEKYLQRSNFIAGEHLTIADVSCVASVSSMDALVPMHGQYERTHEWWNTMKELDWYKTGNAPGLAAFSNFLKQAVEKLSE